MLSKISKFLCMRRLFTPDYAASVGISVGVTDGEVVMSVCLSAQRNEGLSPVSCL